MTSIGLSHLAAIQQVCELKHGSETIDLALVSVIVDSVVASVAVTADFV